jgi:hypothetical protein
MVSTASDTLVRLLDVHDRRDAMLRHPQTKPDTPREEWHFCLADLYPVAGIVGVATYIAMQCLMA